MIKGKIKILESNSKISGNILKSLGEELKLVIFRKKPQIESQIKQLVYQALLDCPEISSLKSGKLKFDFGLDSDPSLEIVAAIINSTYINFKQFKLTLSGVTNCFSIYIQPLDFNNLFNLSSASVVTDKGASLPWLEWLLTAGDAIVITEYHVEYGPYGRSGGAQMIPQGFFKVDSNFSGTPENNFITRALAGYEDKITNIIRNSL